VNDDPEHRLDVAEYALRLGDDALVLAQRLAEWSSHAPELEEDLALTNIALDLLGQARSLLSHAGELEGLGRDEDALAYGRTEREFRNVRLVEQPNGDFARTVARQLLFSGYQLRLYRQLAGSTDPVLAGVAAKAVKEVAYHWDHARQWTVRLGDGTPESHDRMARALTEIWPYGDELFEDDELTERLAQRGAAPAPSSLREGWDALVIGTLHEATLEPPTGPWRPRGGRHGEHGEHLGRLLAELQSVRRAFPGGTW
jgi:ring-1,2-phenylacetyl-CoA epoxidase subunit PaaC